MSTKVVHFFDIELISIRLALLEMLTQSKFSIFVRNCNRCYFRYLLLNQASTFWKRFQWQEWLRNGQPVLKTSHFRTSKWKFERHMKPRNQGLPARLVWMIDVTNPGGLSETEGLHQTIFLRFYQIRSFSSPCTWHWTIRLIVKHWTKLQSPSSKMK